MHGYLSRIAPLAVAAVGVAVIPLMAGSAAAAPDGPASRVAVPTSEPSPQAKARIDLVIHEGSDPGGTVDAQVVLECLPSGGSHPHGTEACDALGGVDADIDALPVAYGACTMISAPVTVTADGYWDRTAVSYQQTFANRCQAELATGQLFRF